MKRKISIRIEQELDEYIDELIEEVRLRGYLSSRTWVISKILKLGVPLFEQEFLTRKKQNQIVDRLKHVKKKSNAKKALQNNNA